MENFGYAVLVVSLLLVLVLSFNVKYVRKDHVLIVEKFGTFNRLIHKRGFCFLIPFVERSYKQVSLLQTFHEIFLHISKNKDNEIFFFRASFDYKIVVPQDFVYSSLTPLTTFNLDVLNAFEELIGEKVKFPIADDQLEQIKETIFAKATAIGLELANFEFKHDNNILK
ncbi:MAG: hypothetical protein WC964_03210 [Acholeplasmataceae bacterium]